METKAKQTRLKKEQEELSKIFKGLPKSKQVLLTKAINKAAYLKVELDELEEDLEENGRVEDGAHGTKVSAYAILYQGYLKTYVSVIRQLLKEVPDEIQDSKLEAFLNEEI